MNNQYLFIIDTDGKRITSLVVGVHGDTMDDLKAKAAKEYPGKTVLEGTEEEQQKFMQPDAIYKDGKFATYVPTAGETAAAERAAIDNEYQANTAQLVNDLQIAQLRGDTDAQQSIMQEFSDMQTAYADAIKE